MLISVLINWWVGLHIEKENIHKKRKAWLTAAIIVNVAILAFFKYASFISENIAAIFGNERLILNIVLPIGISFFTFQMMSYVFDVYYRTASAQKNPFYVALYITLFPQLIAGPIVRYSEVERDILHRRETFDEVTEGVKRFIYGLGKKVLIANYMAQIADNVFDNPSMHTVSIVWLGAIAYTLQIYYDFSGYSDMAIGLGKMFGFHFSENFRYPYMSGRITEFWRRWHISLSTWFRDYVYIPLGGNRVKRSKWICNLFVVWALTGIWHGANWTFLLWGLVWFVSLLTEKLTGLSTKRSTVLSHICTMLIIILAWVIFRSDSIAAGVRYMGEMFGIGCGFGWNAAWQTLRGTWFVLLLAVIGSFPIIPKFRNSTAAKKLSWLENAFLIVVFIGSLLQIVGGTYNPFIYFNF
ncbi:MAG: MBOAT family O-acyltransferase [Eubacteriales bacterium]|nr:MBOAT family O-acyltransferase [Eubacteriales bacterium]